MARSKRTRSKHDATVRRTANHLRNQGFDVRADVVGFRRPDTIYGLRPDIVATKGSQRRIVEVETPDSVASARDRKQHDAFRRVANASKNTTFKRIVTEE